jgi:uncharacterized membrane protein YkoI
MRRWWAWAGIILTWAAMNTPWCSRIAAADGPDIPGAEVAPLRELFARVRERFPGNVLEVELEQEEHGRQAGWVYEVKLLTADGHVLKLSYDAINLELIEVKGRRHQDDD